MSWQVSWPTRSVAGRPIAVVDDETFAPWRQVLRLAIDRTGEFKFEIAEDLGIPLNHGYNGDITAREAGRIGGRIGGNMVKVMIRMAEEAMARGEGSSGSLCARFPPGRPHAGIRDRRHGGGRSRPHFARASARAPPRQGASTARHGQP